MGHYRPVIHQSHIPDIRDIPDLIASWSSIGSRRLITYHIFLISLPIGHHSCAWYTDLVRSSSSTSVIQRSPAVLLGSLLQQRLITYHIRAMDNQSVYTERFHEREAWDQDCAQKARILGVDELYLRWRIQELPTMGLPGPMISPPITPAAIGLVNESTNYIVLASVGTRCLPFEVARRKIST